MELSGTIELRLSVLFSVRHFSLLIFFFKSLEYSSVFSLSCFGNSKFSAFVKKSLLYSPTYLFLPSLCYPCCTLIGSTCPMFCLNKIFFNKPEYILVILTNLKHFERVLLKTTNISTHIADLVFNSRKSVVISSEGSMEIDLTLLCGKPNWFTEWPTCEPAHTTSGILWKPENSGRGRRLLDSSYDFLKRHFINELVLM